MFKMSTELTEWMHDHKNAVISYNREKGIKKSNLANKLLSGEISIEELVLVFKEEANQKNASDKIKSEIDNLLETVHNSYSDSHRRYIHSLVGDLPHDESQAGVHRLLERLKHGLVNAPPDDLKKTLSHSIDTIQESVHQKTQLLAAQGGSGQVELKPICAFCCAAAGGVCSLGGPAGTIGCCVFACFVCEVTTD